MRYATLVGPDKKAYFCRIKDGMAETDRPRLRARRT